MRFNAMLRASKRASELQRTLEIERQHLAKWHLPSTETHATNDDHLGAYDRPAELIALVLVSHGNLAPLARSWGYPSFQPRCDAIR